MRPVITHTSTLRAAKGESDESILNRQFVDALRDMMGLDSLDKLNDSGWPKRAPRKERTTPVRKYVRRATKVAL